LLFQYKSTDGITFDIFAFRMGSPAVISFPKSYWTQRVGELSRYMSDFSYQERPPLKGPVSSSQYSAGQIEISRATQERILSVCIRICDTLQSQST
ncbi:MAG: hypothetical protein HAW67_03680, partial [Endozoicomonadaceae bacterium]|nr:hypothetical protein [Endozoicomonadaceae bacterium]